jgi:hypothetical protein
MEMNQYGLPEKLGTGTGAVISIFIFWIMLYPILEAVL